MKKTLLYLSAFILLFNSFSFALPAIDVNNNSIASVNLLPTELNINYSDITAQNAWRALNTWIWKNNFKTKINLTWWVYFELDQEWITKAFSWTNNFKQLFQSYKSRWIDIWDFEVEDMQMIQYPDRLQIVQKSRIVFSNKAQFNNYKNNVWSFFSFSWSKDQTQIDLDNRVINYYIDKCKKSLVCSRWLNDKQIRDKVVQDIDNWQKELET